MKNEGGEEISKRTKWSKGRRKTKPDQSVPARKLARTNGYEVASAESL